MSSIEQLAADALLERGAGLKIPAPLLYRLFGRKYMRLTIKRLYLGTLLHLSRLAKIGNLEQIDVGQRERVINCMGCEVMSLSIADIEAHQREVTNAVACCLLNSRLKIRLFRWWLARVLRRRCHADQLQEIVMWLFAYSRIESFRNTTELLQRMVMTTRRHSGQTERS